MMGRGRPSPRICILFGPYLLQVDTELLINENFCCLLFSTQTKGIGTLTSEQLLAMSLASGCRQCGASRHRGEPWKGMQSTEV
jgi:hypothetical protein